MTHQGGRVGIVHRSCKSLRCKGIVAGDWHLTRNLSGTIAALRKGRATKGILPHAAAPKLPHLNHQTPVLGNFFLFGLRGRFLANSNPS